MVTIGLGHYGKSIYQGKWFIKDSDYLINVPPSSIHTHKLGGILHMLAQVLHLYFNKDKKNC
jgi:hypothetical protein